MRSAPVLDQPCISRPSTPPPRLDGEFLAVVFSGDVQALGEWPCELTARVPYKFAMVDPRLPAHRDFARLPGMALKQWPADNVKPVGGVCFVFADAVHPAVEALKHAGGIEGEHYAVVDGCTDPDSVAVHAGVSSFIRKLPAGSRIVLLGYGDQGQRIARLAIESLDVKPQRLVAVDASAESRAKAESDGLAVMGIPAAMAKAEAVIFTPLMRRDRLFAAFEAARHAGMPVFDNSRVNSGRRYFHVHGPVRLDAPTSRALHVNGWTIRAGDHGLPIQGEIVRHDVRVLAGQRLRHLHAGHRFTLSTETSELDVSAPSVTDPLDGWTFGGCERAWVALADRPEAVAMAAREFCMDSWPDAARQVLPANHACDMGATTFERVLRRHLDRAEYVMASQTTAQQVVLGVVAAHYAQHSSIIEIGSALGGSGLLMAVASGGNQPFISIDPATGNRDIMRFAFDREGIAHRLQQMVKTSDEAIIELRGMREKAGLVFIDGLHTVEAATRDFDHYVPLVRPGGALLVHDVDPARFSVMRVAIERILPDRRLKAMCLVDGLLVLERRA